MKSIISLLFAAILLVSCGQGTKKNTSGITGEIRQITVGDFLSDAGPYVGQEVQISGTVVHVCRHGGQRLFIVGDDGEERVRIMAGDDISEFNVELEGERVEVRGIVREQIIDETYLAEWEADVLDGRLSGRGEGSPQNKDQSGTGSAAEAAGTDEMTEEGDRETQLERIQQLRDSIAGSGSDHLSDYWIETLSYEVIRP